MIIAHSYLNDQNEIIYQSLEEHLLTVAKHCKEDLQAYHLGKTGYLLGILHDVGKSDNCFKNYILKQTNTRVNHSSAGAKYLEILSNNIPKTDIKHIEFFKTFTQCLQYIITAHHGIYDIFDELDFKLGERLSYDKDHDYYHFQEDVLPFIESLESKIDSASFNALFFDAYQEFTNFIKQNRSKSNANRSFKQKIVYYRLHILIRLLLGTLKHYDIYDTISWHSKSLKKQLKPEKDRTEFWNHVHQNIENVYKNFKTDSAINQARTHFSKRLKEKADTISHGIYSLSLPTGAGKTLAAMRFASRVAARHNKDRIIYTTSYLSVLGQNAEEIRKLIQDDEKVLEHHSNIVQEIEDTKNGEADPDHNQKILYQNYLIDTWESPVVLTTLVQFFNSLMKEKSSHLRRYHHLKNSIIIIDEIQSVPVKVLYHFNEHLNFLAHHLNCVIILCTATQPKLDAHQLLAPIDYSSDHQGELVTVSETEAAIFKRAKEIDLTKRGTKKLSTDELVNHITTHHHDETTLVILNMKNPVEKLYEAFLNDSDYPSEDIYYLTTHICAKHRHHIIEEIQTKIEKNIPIIVISTQLIEAGINVDFAAVYRSLAGLDSLIQAEGRCNRNGKRKTGHFYIIDYQEEDLSLLPEINLAKESTIITLKSHQKDTLDLISLNETYFQKYFITNIQEMEYIIKKDHEVLNLFDLLSTNRLAERKNNQTPSPKIAFNFKTAAQTFKFIDNNTTSVIVHYQNDDLIEQLREAIADYNFKEIKNLLKKLQPTTINVYNIDAYQAIIERFDDDWLGDSILILMPQYYDDKKGLILEDNDMIFY